MRINKSILRYFLWGIYNTLFNISVAYILLYFHWNIYNSQFLAMLASGVNNFYVYKKHTFKSESPKILHFIVLHFANYVIGFLLINIMLVSFNNHYLLYLLTTGFIFLINYFLLSKFIFKR